MSRGAPRPPKAGELLPRAAEATGMQLKLAAYSLNRASEDGGPKAQGFDRILGITIADIDYLEGAIQTGVLVVPIRSVRDNPPWGINCVIMVPVRGRHKKRDRIIEVMTVWLWTRTGDPPQITTAFPKP
jgi:hypothetical protein